MFALPIPNVSRRQVNLQVTSNGYGKHSTSKTQDKKIHACPEMCMKPELPAECWQKIPANVHPGKKHLKETLTHAPFHPSTTTLGGSQPTSGPATGLVACKSLNAGKRCRKSRRPLAKRSSSGKFVSTALTWGGRSKRCDQLHDRLWDVSAANEK